MNFLSVSFFRKQQQHLDLNPQPGNTNGGSITVPFIDLLFDWFGISCMTTDNFCFYLQNRLIQTTQEVNGTVILPPLVFPASTFGTMR